MVGEVAKRVLEPERLGTILDAYVKAAAERGDESRQRFASLRSVQKDAEAGITRLLELVERGLMEAEDGALRERLVGPQASA